MSISDRDWDQWVMQTARHFGDISSIIKETGFGVIDDDHRKMIGQALEINTLMESLDHNEFSLTLIYQLGELCNRLRDTSVEHFKKEEELLAKFKVNGRKDHAHLHHGILKGLDQLISDLAEGKLTVTLNLKRAILDWVVLHINEEDAHLFAPQNLLPIFERELPKNDLEILFPETQIPYVDALQRELQEFVITRQSDETSIRQYKKHFQNLCEYINTLFPHLPVSPSKRYLKVEGQLLQYFDKIIETKEEERDAAIKKWRNQWFLHLHHHIYKEIGIRNWAPSFTKKLKKPAQFSKIIPDLDIEDLDQGRLLSHRLIIKICQQFSRLVANSKVSDNTNQLLKSIKKLRGHLRFQYEMEDDHFSEHPEQLKGLPPWDQHKELHSTWISLLDYFKILIESDQFELAYPTWDKLLSLWFQHELFFHRHPANEKVEVSP
jgi:hemerythrin-like metal-binding protein